MDCDNTNCCYYLNGKCNGSGDCDNTNCCYYLNGKCNGARDGYTIEDCDEHFVDNDTVGTGEDEDYEDYAFADYDCEYGLFGDE